MAIVNNTEARLRNICVREKGGLLHTVSLLPGLNMVDDKIWDAVKGSSKVKQLMDLGVVETAKSGEKAPEKKSRAKTDKNPKLAEDEKSKS